MLTQTIFMQKMTDQKSSEFYVIFTMDLCMLKLEEKLRKLLFDITSVIHYAFHFTIN